ncbi:MAG: hydantoinase/oxoprolinase family protein [Gammaproteobacteria bacterium]|nr:hydantoinase/oxoprolinase family protein [Gammaproteobacteria bacterium]
MRYALAIDTGGTFTDVILLDRESGDVWSDKTPSTPDDPSLGFMDAIERIAQVSGVEATRLAQVFHGTTVATNLILEDKGAECGVLITAGFRHVLDIGRQDIPRRVNLFAWHKPRRPVAARDIFEIPERLDANGGVIETLDEAAVRQAVRILRGRGIAAYAVCFLHSFSNPAHERRAGEIIVEEHPQALVSLSSDVLPQVREYERCMASVLNVTVMPSVSRYVSRLQTRLRDARIAAPLLIMKSNGGVAGADEVRRVPVHTALSGPAAGVVGAAFIGAAAGRDNVIGIDIGGTSADISLVKHGQLRLSDSGHVGRWPLALPMVDINTVGTGGGSIARVTASGALTVGPQSAGAQPGPACYGRGGRRATVTDAHLILGRLPASILGGRMRLDVAAAREAIVRDVAEPLGLTVEAAARGILAISNNDMVGAIRVISIERGEDPRDFALVAFGGAGPLHGSEMARLLGMRSVIVPPSPGVLSALGLLVATLRTDYSQTCIEAMPYDASRIERVFADLERQADAWFERERAPLRARRTLRSASLRYRHQGFELEVPFASGAAPGEVDQGAIAATVEAFHRLHERLYTFAQPDTPVEIVNLRVAAMCELDRPRPLEWAVTGTLADARVGELAVGFDNGTRRTPVYDRARLATEVLVEGPAILTQLDATCVLLPGDSARTDEHGNLVIDCEG